MTTGIKTTDTAIALLLIHTASPATWKALQDATTSTVQTKDRRTHEDQRLTQTCKTDLDNSHALQYIVLTYGIPPGSQSYTCTDIRFYSATELVCSAQPYSTAQPRDSGRLAPPTEPTESHGGRLGIPTHNYTIFLISLTLTVQCMTLVCEY